ncbi:MAG: DNA gyrase inhibitor YacG [Bryobacteraceae bacterium]
MAVSVRCPICKKDVTFDNPYMPFCSDRCRIIDLGNWASEKYVISTPTRQNETDEFEESEPPEGLR